MRTIGVKKGKPKGRKVLLAIIIVAAILIACGATYVMIQGKTKAEDDARANNNLFASGIHIMDIDMSGKTRERAKAILDEAIQGKIAEMASGIVADGKTYALEAEQLGISHDAERVIEEAFAYGKNMPKAQTDETPPPRVDFDVAFSYGRNAIAAALQQYSDEIDVPAENATVEIRKSKDEPREITGTERVFTEGKTGRELDINATAEALLSQLGDENYEPVEATLEVVEPDYSKADLERVYGVIGTFETEYPDSVPNRRYNIWKMGDAINAVRIEPGQTWSINEQAGPRTNELGWKDAPGITNGELVDQPGGGICQVSSTLYNAVIRAELEIVEKTNHSWKQGYTDGGLDATISTDWPDFKFKNNQSLPVFILVDCDGENRKIRVSIYGPQRGDGLTIGFSSEKIDEFRDKPEKVVEDPDLPAGERKVKQSERIGMVYQVYKHWYDEDGEEIRKEPYEKVTYKHIPAIVYVGTKPAEPMPTPVVEPPAELPPEPAEPLPAPTVTEAPPSTEPTSSPVQEQVVME